MIVMYNFLTRMAAAQGNHPKGYHWTGAWNRYETGVLFLHAVAGGDN